MITISKLEKIPRNTRLRKIARLLQRAEVEIIGGRMIDREYYLSIMELAERDLGIVGEAKGGNSKLFLSGDMDRVLRKLNDMKYRIQAELGITVAEWDFIDTDELLGGETEKARRILPIEVFLEDIRSPYNVGSIFRTAEAFGVSRIVLSASTPSPQHPRASRTSRGTHRIVQWCYGDLKKMAEKDNIFALEGGGIPIDQFDFPGEGIVLVGSEELGLSPEALDIARNSRGIVSIPMFGLKRSLNVSVAFGILLYLWSESILDTSGI